MNLNLIGSQQIFRRTHQVIPQNFTYFLSQFPTHPTNQYQVGLRPIPFQSIRLQMAWKFLVQAEVRSQADLSVNDRKDHTLGKLYRLLLGTPQAPPAGYSGYTTYYAITRLPLSPHFYTLVIREKGYAYGKEANYDLTYLYNFDKQGKLLDTLKVGGISIGMMHFELRTTSHIKGLQITVIERDYNGPYSKTKYPKTDTKQYIVLPTGKFKQKQ